MSVPVIGTIAGRQLITDLQSFGLQIGGQTGGVTRKGGAGPSDHKAITIAGQTVMVPVYTADARRAPGEGGGAGGGGPPPRGGGGAGGGARPGSPPP
ncbi:MAG: hypothetical protein ABF665_19380, partial [Gluconacetobacter sp.]